MMRDAIKSNMKSVMILRIVMLNVVMQNGRVPYTEYHFTECHIADCCGNLNIGLLSAKPILGNNNEHIHGFLLY